MKRFVKIVSMPLINLVLVPVIITLLSMHEMATSISFINPIAIALYVLSGFLFSRIDNKKDKIISSIITLVLTIAIGVVLAIAMFESDAGTYYALFAMPIAMALFSLFRIDFYHTVFVVLLAPVSTVISVVSDQVFSISDKKKRRIGSIIVVAITVLSIVGLVISGVIVQKNIKEDSYKGDNGEYYTAYFDMNGNKYESQNEVPYYDREGNVYYWTFNDEGSESDYAGEVTASDGTVYNWEIAYIDTDGYLFIDKKGEIHLRDDLPDDAVTDWDYCDKNGNVYSTLLAVNYDRDGKPYVGIGNQYK